MKVTEWSSLRSSLTDLENGEAANRLYAEYFPTKPPARSSPIVKLPRGLLISIEAIAVVP